MKYDYPVFYRRISAPFRKNGREKMIVVFDRMLSYIFYISYPILLIILFVNHSEMLWKTVLIPGCSFVAVSLFRKLLNRPRPYEKEDIDPIIQRDKKGESLPSRHVFSSSIIAISIFVNGFSVGIIYLFMALLCAFCRVTGGVHYPSDVISAILAAVIVGFLYL